MMKPWSSFVRAAALAPAMFLSSVGLVAAQADAPLDLNPAVIRAVRYHVEPARTRVWFETSGTLFYTHYSPDPLTLVIDLPSVDVAAIADRTVVGSQEVESIAATQLDGAGGKSLSRIEIKLASLVPYQISATEHALTILFEGAGSPSETPPIASTSDAPPPPSPTPTAAASETETGNEDITTRALSPQEEATVPATPTPAPNVPSLAASSVESISHAVSDGLLTVTVGGNGRLNYTSFRLADPARLVFDFAGTVNHVPMPRLDIDAVGVYRARVAQFQSANPKITRIVFDLDSEILHRAISEGSDLKIHFSASADRLAELGSPPEDTAHDQMAAVGMAEGTRGFTAFALHEAGTSSPMASMRPVAVVAQSLTPGLAAPSTGSAPGLPEPPQEPPMPETGVSPQSEQARALQDRTIGAGQREYTGDLISLDFKDGDIQDIFRLFADISGLNIVVQPGVTGRITLVLTEVPWDQALDLILKSHRLGYVVEGNVIRIAPLNDLAQEEADRRRLAEEQALAGDLSTMLRELSYAKAGDVQGLIQRNLSARGDVSIDQRTNTLIITDLPDRLDTIDSLIDTLDAPIPGVEIEARIVVTTRNFTRDLGIQWGFGHEQSVRYGNTTDRVFPNSIIINGAGVPSDLGIPADQLGPGGLSSAAGIGQATRGYMVNLPASSFTSGIGISMGNILGSFNLDVALTALERQGRGRLLSTPKVTTQNNQSAEIKQGLQIPIQTVANNTVTVQFKDAVLTLKVTPQITDAGTVILNLEVENNSADFANLVNGIPPINTQSAKTIVLVRDGQTAVVGGIYQSTETTSQGSTPFLSKIPILGYLFKSNFTDSRNNELLLFITPRIVKS